MTDDEIARHAVELSAELGDLHARTMSASRERRELIVELRSRGWSDIRIAELLGITRQAVLAIRSR